MRIAVVGTGYVGLVTGVCLAEMGHRVVCVDVDEAKIATLQAGVSPIYEPGLEDLLVTHLQLNRLSFTTNHDDAFADAELIYLAVGTPEGEDGLPDLTALMQVAKTIGRTVRNDVIVVTKSTVPVGTNQFIHQVILKHLGRPVTVHIASNPEFLREGQAIHDTFHGDRIIIGAEHEVVLRKLEEIYQDLNIPILKTDIRSAEMIKYASNAFLATKISFINEIANLCGKLGSSIEDVAKGMGMDQRIGEKFLQAGIGYGGSCFPKDVKALISLADMTGYPISILRAVEQVNLNQRQLLVSKARKRFGDLEGKRIALLGLAFKPNTDDMREAPSLVIARELVEEGAKVVAYDPIAMDKAKQVLPRQVELAPTADSALCDVDAVFVLTEWEEFTQPDFVERLRVMREPIVFDGRNCLHLATIKERGIEYHSIGREVDSTARNRYQSIEKIT